MATAGVSLTIPPGNGTGAASSTSNLGTIKTIVVTGDFNGNVIVEASAGGSFCQVAFFQRAGQRRIAFAATEMRVTVQGNTIGTVTAVDVQATATDVVAVELPIPSTPGAGASVDVSALGDVTSIYIHSAATYTGTIHVETSQDGTNYSQIGLSKASPGGCQTVVAPSVFMRAVRTGDGGVEDVWVSAEPAGQGGGAGDTAGLTSRDDGTTINYYVDQNVGNDANIGTDPGAPLETIQEVQRRTAYQLYEQSTIIVNFLNSSGVVDNYTVDGIHLTPGMRVAQNATQWRGPAMLLDTTLATGSNTATLDGTTPAERVDQTEAPDGAGQRTRLNMSASASWTDDDLRGRFVRVTRGGNLVIFECPITDNDSGSLVIDISTATNFLAGDTVEIVNPAVRISASGANAGLVNISGGAGTANAGALGSSETDGANFERLEFSNIWCADTFLTFDRCRMGRGTFLSGLNINGGAANYVNTISEFGAIHGCTSQATPAARLDSGSSPINTGTDDGTCILVVGAPFEIGTGQNAATPGFSGVLQAAQTVSVYGTASGPGILVHGYGSRLRMDSGGGIPAVTGKDNEDVGLACRFGGLARVNGGQRCTITGLSGDLEVSGGGAVSYGTGAGEFEEVAGYNGNLTRGLDGTSTAPIGDFSMITTRTS
ncbi:MAG: hypothetical protein R3322_00180 [Kiloniellales bacterium]|nr:hypothetical protein [Kiloniellales bacterium]